MSRIRCLLLSLAVFALAFSPAYADELFSLKGGYAIMNPDGDFAVTADGLPGTKIDFDDDLGFDDSEEFFYEAGLQFGPFRVFAAYLPIKFSGDGTLSQDINFDGETFVAGSKVNSDVDIDIYEAGLAWYLVNLDDLPVRVQLGPEVAVKYVDASLKMKEKETGMNASDSVKAPIPTLGVRSRLAMADMFGIVGRAGYMEYSGNSFLDVDAQVEFSPIPLVGVFGGYRYLDIDVDEDGVLVDATFDGPYVGALVRF